MGGGNLKTVVQYTTEILCKHGLKDTNQIQEVAGVMVYPKEYFCPLRGNIMNMTKNTLTIHHYAGSWISLKDRLKRYVACVLGYNLTHMIIRFKRFLYRKDE